MELPYKISYFLIFLLLPFMGAILLVLIKFLFLDDSDVDKRYSRSTTNNNSSNRNNIFKLIISSLYILGFTFTLISLSAWSFLSVYVVILLSVLLITSFTLYQLVYQLKIKRKRQKIKVVNINTLNSPTIIGNTSNSIIEDSNNNNSSNSNNNDGEDLKNLLDIESPKLRKGFYAIHLKDFNNTNNTDNIQQHDENDDEEDDDDDDDYKYYYENTLEEEGQQRGQQEFYFNSLELNSKQHMPIIQRIKFRLTRFKWDLVKVWQYKKVILVCSVIASVFLGIFLPLFFENVCICSHPMSISTKMTRKTYCPSGRVCFVYLSLPKDPSHSMIIQFHTRDEPSSAYLSYYYFDTFNSYNTSPIAKDISNYISMDQVIKDESRYVSFIELLDLKPDTEYFFNIHVETTHQKVYNSTDYSFKTLPFNNDDIKFIVGGDIDLNNEAQKLGKLVSDYQPHFVVIGGDIAYEDGIGSCYQRWDEKLLFFQNTLSKNNRLLPLVLSIGNHEAGAFFQTWKQVPFYFDYFVFKIGDSAYPVHRRDPFHIHKISTHSSIVSLDSCVTRVWSEQVEWLDDTWSSTEFKDTSKMVVYHTPIFPASTPLDGKIAKLGVEYIVPLFDKFQVPLSFENHEHLFKRTKPLRYGQISKNGTVYVGDGAWGISSNQIPRNGTGIFEKVSHSK